MLSYTMKYKDMEVESISVRPEHLRAATVIDPDYLERRSFICPDCGQPHVIYVYERNNDYYLMCQKCGSRFFYDWNSEKFLNESRDIHFKEI